MKKQLLLGAVLLAGISAFSQSNRKPQATGVINTAEIIARKFTAVEPTEAAKPAPVEPSKEVTNLVPETFEQASSAAPSSTISWKQISGSSNVYGQLVSNSKPLQYNPDLKAISYIHRKSQSYTATPAIATGGQSGVIVADISLNQGVNWDSTCVWADGTNGGRYPQGAIYSAPGNTNISNAYIVATGPVVSNSAFVGCFYASKKLGVAGSTVAYNTTPDQAIGGQQFVNFATSKNSWARYGFTSTSDGVVRSLNLVEGNPSGTGNAKMRGVAVVKGTFAAGVFNWAYGDSILPSTYTLSAGQGTNSGTKVLSSEVQMAWNQTGTHGYVVMIGALASQTNLANKGYQPIIYKTTTGGASWTSITGMDFSTPSMSLVTNPLIASRAAGVSNSLSAPFFKDWDIAVDVNNRLHIGATCVGQYYSHTDSLGYTAQFTSDNYAWPHQPGLRPFIYDFVGDGTGAWNVQIVDTMWTEDPGADPSQVGFPVNPWDATGVSGAKVNVDPRLQLARTPDGNYITFSWAESDTNFIAFAKKWNLQPDIKARCVSAVNGSLIVSNNEINVSKVASGQGAANIQVAGKAFLHYMAPTTAGQITYTAVLTTSVDIYTPFTVTNSAPLQQLTNNRNWYGNAKLSWWYSLKIDNVKENNSLNSAINSAIFPNPANSNATLAINLKENTSVDVSVHNLVGQLVKTTKANGQLGENNINIDLANLKSGIYMVTVKVGSSTSTKKLIVE